MSENRTINTRKTHVYDLIDRQAVLKAINNMVKECDSVYVTSALRNLGVIFTELPSAQPETHEERTETHDVCLDTISRQAALDWLKNEWNGMVTSLFDGIKALPSAQPEPTQVARDIATILENEKDMRVIADISEYSDKLWRNAYERGKAEAQAEIVRCKDCKYWREGTVYSYCDKLFGMGVLDAYDYMTDEDDYCSMAERKTDEKENI